MKRTRVGAVALSALFLLAAIAQAQGQQAAGPERWEPNVLKFEEADRQKRPAPGAFVFIGASTVSPTRNCSSRMACT